MKYIIEVQKICVNLDDKTETVIEEYEHIGYMNMIFKYGSDAKKYIKKHNPHLRMRGGRRPGFYSSTDLITKMRFVIRTYRNEKLNLPTF
jgi:hypothetical protein